MIRQAKDIECAIQSVSSWASKTLAMPQCQVLSTRTRWGLVRVICNGMGASQWISQ